MKTLITPILTSATLIAAIPALAADDAESDIMGVCQGALMPADTDADSKYSQGEVEALRNAEFEQLDANKDGSIDREEYVACMKGAQEAEAKMAQEFKDSNEFEMNRWLDLSDADQMTREEYAAFAEEAWDEGDEMKKDSVARMRDEDKGDVERFAHAAAQRFRSHDADGDGIITQEEYENSPRGREFDAAAVERRFDNLDADDSGGISPQEYRPGGVWAHGALGSDQSTDTGSDGSDTAQSADDMAGETADAQDGDGSGTISIIRYYMLSD